MKSKKVCSVIALLLCVCLLFTACGGGAGGNPVPSGGNPAGGGNPSGGLDSTPKTFTLTAGELHQKIAEIRQAIRDHVWATGISITLVITDEAPDFAAIGEEVSLYYLPNADITLDLSQCTGVSKVKEGDFNSTGFNKLILPEGITEIEYNSFSVSTVRSISIPSTLTSFENDLFRWLDSLEEVNFAEENPYYCSVDGIVYTKNKQTLVLVPRRFLGTTITMPKELSEIEKLESTDGPFENLKNLETIVVEQGGTAFASANGALLNADKTELLVIPPKMTSFEMPATVTDLKDHCISDAKSLESFTVEEGSETFSAVDNYLLDATGTILVAVPPMKKNVVVPSTVTEIGKDSFWNCKVLETVTIPEGVQTIGNAAFVGCDNLTELIVPSTVTSIGFMFLYNCSKCKTLIMKSLTPPTVTINDPFLENTTGFTVKVPADSVADYQAWALYQKSQSSGADAQKWQRIHDAIVAM